MLDAASKMDEIVLEVKTILDEGEKSIGTDLGIKSISEEDLAEKSLSTYMESLGNFRQNFIESCDSLVRSINGLSDLIDQFQDNYEMMLGINGRLGVRESVGLSTPSKILIGGSALALLGTTLYHMRNK